MPRTPIWEKLPALGRAVPASEWKNGNFYARLRIAFTVEEAHVGHVLAVLADKVQDLHFELIEDLPFDKNPPRKAKGKAYVPPPTRAAGDPSRSKIPALFKSELAGLKRERKPLNTDLVRAVLKANKMAPATFSHALVVLQKAGAIRKTDKQGVYEVI